MTEQKKLSLPLLNTSIFAMVVMTLLIATAVSILLYKDYMTNLKKQRQEFSQKQAEQAKYAVQKSIENYKTILKDYSNFPLLKLAAMQPDSSLEDAIDMMKSFSFLGEMFPMAICDFEGRPLHDFFKSKELSAEVFKSLQSSKNFQLSKNINVNNKNLFLITAPIVQKGSNEGALCMLIPTTELITKSMNNKSNDSLYKIYKGKIEIYPQSTKELPKDLLKASTILFDDISIVTFLDPLSLEKAQNSLFGKLFVSILVIITLISLLTFLIINRFLLKPIVSLCEMSYAVTQNHDSQPIAIDSPIKEVSLLKEDIKTMITTLNQRSDELNVANNALEQRVKDRTKELEEKANELEMLAKYKSEFLARMSHEIRTPMNAIIGYTDILKETRMETEQENHLKIISSSADALLTVINDILDFSKIEAGMMTIETIPFNINKILNDINHLFLKSADDKGLKLAITTVNEDLQWLSGDPHRIRQVLINLTGNAIKFTPKGTVSVKAEASELKNNKVRLDIIIEDTGIGIPKDKLEDVFNSFSQAEGSVSRKYGGTGLGLPISKELTELMDGSLNVSSEEAKGTTFRFSLISEKTKALESTSSSDLNIDWSRKPKVLLVEDNIVNLKLAEKTLKSFNVEYISCESGLQALHSLQNNNYFDLVLMDCQMPEMDGLEATREIRKMKNLEAMPIIAFTANALEDEIKECYEAGMNDYISKPFKKETFSEKLRKWLNSLIKEELSD